MCGQSRRQRVLPASRRPPSPPPGRSPSLRHPVSARAPAPPRAHLLDGGGRDLPLAPLPRCCERHRHVATEPAIGESGALRGPRSWGPDARLPGRPTSARAEGGRGSRAARIAGQARLSAEPQLPARRLRSSSRPELLEPRAPPPPPARLSWPAFGRHPRARALMVAPRRPPPPGRSGNGPAAAGGSGPAALSQETRGPPAKLSPTAPATLRGRGGCPESPGPPPRREGAAGTRERLPGRQRERGFAGLNGSLRSTCAPWSRWRARKV